jgi:hypothetical protein
LWSLQWMPFWCTSSAILGLKSNVYVANHYILTISFVGKKRPQNEAL